MKTMEELAATGLRGEALVDAMYEDMFGRPPVKNPTPEQRRASMARFFEIMDSMSEEELADNPLADRPATVLLPREPAVAVTGTGRG